MKVKVAVVVVMPVFVVFVNYLSSDRLNQAYLLMNGIALVISPINKLSAHFPHVK